MRSRPRQRLETAWRALRTGVAFAAFGLGSLWLSFFWLPVRSLFDRSEEPWRQAQLGINRLFRFHQWLMETLGLIEVHWVGLERLNNPQPKIIVANHPSLIDVVLIIARLPQADCIVASSRASNRWLAGSAGAADYIRNDSGAAVVQDAARRLREGRTLVVFPEGTRTPESGDLGPFQRGPAHIALAAGVDMLPIEITVQPRMLMKGQSWYHVPPRAGVYTLRVGEPVVAKKHLDGGESSVMAARKLTRALRARFVKGSTDAGD